MAHTLKARGIAALGAICALLNVSGAAAQSALPTLVHDAGARSSVPIPPSEMGLQTIVAEPWLDLPNRRIALEGPAFDRSGNLLMIDMMSGDVLRIASDKTVSTVIKASGVSPTGLAIHRDGRLFLAGVGNLMSGGSITAFSVTGRRAGVIVPPERGFIPDDLAFDATGGFYFADFKGTSTRPTGGVYHVSADGRAITPVLPDLGTANGVGLSPDGKTLWVTEYAKNVLHRVSLTETGTVAPLGTAVAYHFTGPHPDSLRIDAEGNVYVAIFQQGRVLVFNEKGLPIGQILIPGRDEGRYLATTSLAMKPDTNELYIVSTDGEGTSGAKVFRAAGFAKASTLFSHR